MHPSLSPLHPGAVLFALSLLAATILPVAPAVAQPGNPPTAVTVLRYPATDRRPVTDTYQGTAGPRAVVDDYRWLESHDDPAVKDWVALQNTATRRVLDALPTRIPIRDELRQLIGRAPVTRANFAFAGGRLFAMKRQPPKNQRMLVVIDALDALAHSIESERTVVDPNLRNDKGTTAIDWYVPSHDGKLVAVSLSDNGSERGTVRVFETDTGNERSDIVPRVQMPSGGGSLAWNADASGFWYTRYPAPLERPKEDSGFYQQVWFHKLGTRSTFDTYAFGRELPRIAEIRLEASEDGRHLLAEVRNGDGGEQAVWLRQGNDQWKQVAAFTDGIRMPHFGRDDRVYAIALHPPGNPSATAPMKGRIVAMRRDGPSLARATTVVPESDLAIEHYVATASRLYVEASSGGPTELKVYGLKGNGLPGPAATPYSSATIGTRLAGDAILFATESYLVASSWSLVDPRRDDGRPVRTALSESSPDLGVPDVEVRRITARSKDGTQVPVNLVMAKGLARDGSHPVLLTAYGGYGISSRPRFSRRVAFWLRHGGIFAQANVRGGNEFGDRWHRDGKLVRKQNVFDDFAAAARALADAGYTEPKRLAIEGGSNGGLLMGAELVQHPELFGAVVSHVGIYDMLRVECSVNGEFNTTEFGSVKEPTQFDALIAYSPLHGVEDGRDYPPVLLLAGINDGRVEPWQSFKMAARLQAANPAGQPVLLRVAGDAGHGQGMSLTSAIEQDADVFAFLFDRLGMTLDDVDAPRAASTKAPLPPPIGLPAPRSLPMK